MSKIRFCGMLGRIGFLFFLLLLVLSCPLMSVDMNLDFESPLMKEWVESEVKKQVGEQTSSLTVGMRVDYFLKSKLLGATVWYSDSSGAVIGRGPVQSIVKQDDGYEVSVYDTLLKSMVLLRVVFEGAVGTGPTVKRRELELAPEMKRKRTYEAEKQLSVSLSPLISGETGSSAALATTFADPVVVPYPDGELVLVSDIGTGKRERLEVVIYKGSPLLSDGTPLKMRLERI